LKIVFVSPYQAEAELLDYGLHLVRGEPFNVTDTLGKKLIEHPLFEEYGKTVQTNPMPSEPVVKTEQESV